MASNFQDKDRKRKRVVTTIDKSPTKSHSVELKKPKTEVKTKQDARAAFFAEENEALDRDQKKDLGIYKNACDEIRRCMEEIHTLKSSHSKTKASEIEELRINASLQFLVIKKLNRLSHLRCKKVRDKTSETRRKTDQYHLELQNLLYEVTHLQKEITKCHEFKSKDEEIELVSVEDFYDGAPPEISKPEITREDKHQQTLARLDFELEQRKILADKLKTTQESKEMISEEIEGKKEGLDSLRPKLDTILQATKPVQDYLQMPFDEIRDQYATACHLPEPLYVLYMQASAYQEACDTKLTVRLEGDTEAAKMLETTTTEDIEEEDDDSDGEETSKRKSKHRRKTAVNRLALKRERALKRHPLSVMFTIACPDDNALELTFCYLLKLKVITVIVKPILNTEMATTSVSGGDLLSPIKILSCLYPEDYGDYLPNPANKYELEQAGIDDIGAYMSEIGHPYQWAQRLAGLEFLSETSTQQQRVAGGKISETINRIRTRLRARISLETQLVALESHSVSVSGEYVDMFPAKISSHLSTWKRINREHFRSLEYCERLVAGGLVKESDMYFMAVLERGSAKLNAAVVLSPDYPSASPLFCIQIIWKTERNNKNDENISAMEAELNIYSKELARHKSRDQLLANQIQRLLMCFDVYLETETDNSSVDGPAEIPKERVFPRPARGPARAKPYRYNNLLGLFQHR